MRTFKIITLLALTSLVLSTGCSKEEESLCDCKEVRYTMPPGQGLTFHSTFPRPDLNCDARDPNTHYDGTYHVKIQCD